MYESYGIYHSLDKMRQRKDSGQNESISWWEIDTFQDFCALNKSGNGILALYKNTMSTYCFENTDINMFQYF